MNIRKSKIFKIFNPQIKIGALEISDVELKFTQIKGDKLISNSLKLENGIIKDGRINDKNGFSSALVKFHDQIAGNKRKQIYAIVNIPDNNIYAQLFSIPVVSDANLREAANLNMQMMSPINFDDAYSDWQITNQDKDGKINGNQLEILGAFAQKEMINEFEVCLKGAGIIPAAIEFGGLALARLATELGENIDAKNPFILFYVGINGLNFNLVKNGNLYFNHFVSWQSVYSDERRISLESFQKLIVDEVRKISSFYTIHWGGQVSDVYLATYGLKDEIIKILSQNFSFNVKILSLKKFKDISQSWFIVIGSALRGQVSRSEDTIISLASVDTEKEFDEQRIIWFIKFRRNIIFTSLVAMVAIFSAAEGFLIQNKNSLEEQLASLANNNQKEMADVEKMQLDINNINKKIGLVAQAYNQRVKWSLFFEKIKVFAGDKIIINRIAAQSLEQPVLISALAASDDEAINFKNKLSADVNFENVDMPINKIVQAKNGVEFTITFKIKSL